MVAEPLTDEQYAKLPQRVKTLDDLKADYQDFRDNDRKLQTRWILGLAIANGGALTALSGKLLDLLGTTPTDQGRAALALALPSLWLFTGGFVLVGLAVLLELLRNSKSMRQVHRSIRVRQAHDNAVTYDMLDPPQWKTWIVEIGAGLAFVAGLFYPACVLAVRYFRDGGVTW